MNCLTQISHLRQSLHHCIEQGPDPFGHLQKLENPGNSENPHNPDNSGVDDEGLTLYLLKTNSYYGQDSYGKIQLVPSLRNSNKKHQQNVNALLISKVSRNANSKHFKDDFTEEYGSKTVVADVQGQIQVLKMNMFNTCAYNTRGTYYLRHHVEFHCHCNNIDSNDC